MADDSLDGPIYLVGEAGKRSGFKIRPMRVCVGVEQLKVKLAEQGFPDRRSYLPYMFRVYQVFGDKQPKKLSDSVLLDLLAARQYDDAEPVLRAVDGQGVPPTTHRRPPLSEAASAERRPLPPEVLASGEERLHHEVKGRGRPARTARSRNRGQS